MPPAGSVAGQPWLCFLLPAGLRVCARLLPGFILTLFPFEPCCISLVCLYFLCLLCRCKGCPCTAYPESPPICFWTRQNPFQPLSFWNFMPFALRFCCTDGWFPWRGRVKTVYYLRYVWYKFSSPPAMMCRMRIFCCGPDCPCWKFIIFWISRYSKKDTVINSFCIDAVPPPRGKIW